MLSCVHTSEQAVMQRATESESLASNSMLESSSKAQSQSPAHQLASSQPTLLHRPAHALSVNGFSSAHGSVDVQEDTSPQLPIRLSTTFCKDSALGRMLSQSTASPSRPAVPSLSAEVGHAKCLSPLSAVDRVPLSPLMRGPQTAVHSRATAKGGLDDFASNGMHKRDKHKAAGHQVWRYYLCPPLPPTGLGLAALAALPYRCLLSAAQVMRLCVSLLS